MSIYVKLGEEKEQSLDKMMVLCKLSSRVRVCRPCEQPGIVRLV